jgi:predicted Zn finger-like uncharacterized protein
MRLICPNCDAQYEVPDDVMPTSGRDVQCSNCGQTWFQHHPEHTPDAHAASTEAPAADEEVAPPPHPPEPAPAPVRKQLDPAVADILRQEAEAEQAARRRAQADPLESQPELGMDLDQASQDDSNEADLRAQQARERMARMRGQDEPPAPPRRTSDAAAETATAAAALGSRRDLLPDIDEINSTLRSDAQRNTGGEADGGPGIEAPSLQRNRRGFRRGFVTMLFIFAVFAVIYVFAPRFSAVVPALKAPLQSYVSVVDQGRSWLDTRVKDLLRSLDATAQGSESGS